MSIRKRLALALVAAASAALATAVGCLLATGGLGPVQVAQAKAHLNLVGWASLAAVWLAYARKPALAENRRAAAAQAALSFLAALGFPAGMAVAHETGDQRLLLAAAAVWLASALLFLACLAALARPAPARAG